MLLVFIFAAVFANSLTPYDPNATNTSYAQGKPQPPSLEHSLGTDNYGRDYLSRTISSIRISLLVGVSAVLFQLFIGVLFGTLTGYFGGWIDNLLMRVTDVFLAIPSFMLLLSVTGIFRRHAPCADLRHRRAQLDDGSALSAGANPVAQAARIRHGSTLHRRVRRAYHHLVPAAQYYLVDHRRGNSLCPRRYFNQIRAQFLRFGRTTTQRQPR